MKTIFVVDDNDVNLLTAETALNEEYNIFTLASASDMLEFLDTVKPDLILLDIVMPDMNGFEAMKKLKQHPRYHDIPVIFLTGRRDPATEAKGFEMGAVDFISKPFSQTVLLNRIKTHLKIEDIIKERTSNIKKLKDGVITVLANMVESRDSLTAGHIERTTNYIKILLDAMMYRGIYNDEIEDWDLELVVASARLHDVGKIVITDLILNKPGKLEPEEFENIKTHAAEGQKIIDDIAILAGDEEFLQNAKLFAGYHHERWDGTGYPYGLKGRDIPLKGRIMALVDVYDALTSVRPYKKAFPHKEAVKIIEEGSGTHFDPELVKLFLEINNTFLNAEVDGLK